MRRLQQLRAGRAFGTAVIVTGLVAALGATRAPADGDVPGLSFRVSASTRIYAGAPSGPANEIVRGRGVAAQNQSRIELLAFTPAPQGITTDDYLIALDSGKVFVHHVNPERYTPANDLLGGPAVVALTRLMGGRGIGARGARGGRGAGVRGARGARGAGRARGGVSGGIDQPSLLDVRFALEKLGPGETIDGRPTQHYRITTDYRILWGDQSVPARGVTEVWATPLPTTIPNPFEPLIVADQSTDGPLIEYALKLRAVRAQIEGTPIKVVTTTTISEIGDVEALRTYAAADPEDPHPTLTIVQQTQITNIAPAEVDPSVFAIRGGS